MTGREGVCPGPSPLPAPTPTPTYDPEGVAAIVGPGEGQVVEAEAAGEGAGQQDLRAVDGIDGGGLPHRHLQRQGRGQQEETCAGTTPLTKALGLGLPGSVDEH